MQFKPGKIKQDTLVGLYKKMLLPRLVEEKMLLLLRQGQISKWFSGIGQEAIAAGVTAALSPEEYVLPMHRNLGVFTGREVPLERLLRNGKEKQVDLPKAVIAAFILEARSITS